MCGVGLIFWFRFQFSRHLFACLSVLLLLLMLVALSVERFTRPPPSSHPTPTPFPPLPPSSSPLLPSPLLFRSPLLASSFYIIAIVHGQEECIEVVAPRPLSTLLCLDHGLHTLYTTSVQGPC